MPSQMDQRHRMSEYRNPTIVASSFTEDLWHPSESRMGFWKSESLTHNMASKSIASSPLEKPQPIGTKIGGHQELLQPYDLLDPNITCSLEHKLFGQERHVNLPRSPWNLDQKPIGSSLKESTLFSEGGRINPNGVYNENGLFSSSFSDIFDMKLSFTSKKIIASQPIEKVGLSHVDDEPFELTREVEAQTIGNLLPDDDELLSGILDETGYKAHVNNGNEVDDDIFYSGGGIELESDENKKMSELNVGPDDRLGVSNGTLNGDHLHGVSPSRTLFIRNINSNVEDSELKLIFEHYGDIRTIYTACKHRGFVMISYYDIRSAQNAMKELQNKPLKRRKLDIHYSIPKDNPSEKDINQGNLVVFNVDLSITNDDLHRIFGDYGQIKEIRDTPQMGNHKIIEFYDIRDAEAALHALNVNNVASNKVKLETRPLVHHMSPELGQEDFGVCKLESPSTNSPSMASLGSTNSSTITSIGLESGCIHGMHSVLQTSMNPFRDASFLGLSSKLSWSLSSPIRVASAATHSNQPTPSEFSPSLGRLNGHMSHSIQSMGGIANSSPYNLNTMPPIGVNRQSRASEAMDSRHLYKAGSGNLNGHSTDRSEGGSGSCPLRSHQLMWNSSNDFQHHQNSSLMWPNLLTFANSISSRPHTQMHGLPRAPSHMSDNVVSMHQHHVGSAPTINPSVWDRRHTEPSSFHPSSIGNTGFPSSPHLHPLDLNNIFSPTGGNCMDQILSPANIGMPSPHQRGMFHGRNPMIPLPPFDSPGERTRVRRNDSSNNQSDNKRQYDLDIECIMRGEDSRTTLMIKNIPNKYTSKMLLAAIDENHKGTYDFIYLPIDFKNKCNVGYAFINMTNSHHIIPFYQNFNGKKWEKFNSEKVASLAYARIQGKSALIAHFQNSSLMNEDKRCRPILFHSNGPNAGDQEPFPMGTNIRARLGRSRTFSGGDNRQQDPTMVANFDTSLNGADTSGLTKDTE